jgi:hypothetical protein
VVVRLCVFVAVVSVVVAIVMVSGGRPMDPPIEQNAIGSAAPGVEAHATGGARLTSGDGAEPRCVMTSVGTDPATGRLATIGAVIGAIRAGECAAASPRLRMCRSLFLAAATDPIAGVGAGLDALQLQHLAGLHDWALAEAADAAASVHDDELEVAFRTLAGFDLGAALSVDDDAVAAIAIARTDSAILDPLVRAENDCR